MEHKSVLLIHRYYFPDTPAYAIMLHRIAMNIYKTGCQVNVFTSMPSYYGTNDIKPPSKENINGIKIFRSKLLPEPNRALFLRTLNSFLFSFIVFFKILFGEKHNLVTVATTPPIIISSLVKLACMLRRIPYIYHCQDIYPEIAFYSGNLRNKTLYKILKIFDTHTCKKAKKIVVLSSDMKKTLIQRGIKKEKIEVINNFIRSSHIKEEEVDLKTYKINDESFKIVFCGNLGKMQKLEMILKAFIKVLDNNIESSVQLIFIGEGVLKPLLIKMSGEYLNKEVIFTGYQPLSKAINFLKKCDLGLIPIAEGVHKTAYPSKTMTNLSCGLKSLVLVEESSELNGFFSQNKLGFSASPNDLNAIIESYQEAILAGRSNTIEKERITKVANENFSESYIMKKWINTISDLTTQ